MRPSFGFALIALTSLGLQPCERAAVLTYRADQLFASSVTEHVRLDTNRAVVELESGELFEDDGPAAGHSYLLPRNQERLTPDTWIKKDLIIPNPEAHTAYLIVLSDDSFETMINGVPQHFVSSESGRQGYKTYAFNAGLLKSGHNELVLHDSGNVMIAREDEFALGSRTRTHHPNRSAKSTDSGKTWDYEHLGPGGRLDGEYGVRVFLDHFQPNGSILMPVIDAGNLEESPIAPLVKEIGTIKISLNGDTGPRGAFRVRARSGPTCVPSDSSWSKWQLLPDVGGRIEKPYGRFVQIAIVLSTQDGLHSPRLKTVEVSAAPQQLKSWTSRLQVLGEHNETILRTSIPFEYEPLNHPRLKDLRAQYRLDDLVRGSASELELLLRLAQWACNYWDWPNHITEQYPPWDALEILRPHKDGTPVGGFCQQFNLVFLQACESFGFSGRAISISQGRLQSECPGGGHEIVELWSNEWRKWVYVDGALAWYIVDEKTGTPLSMLELRERQLALLHGKPSAPVRVVDAVRTKNKQFLWNGLAAPKPLNWYFELRMIPRSNFLQEKSPLPLNQGTEEWAWSGHYVWTDDEVRAGLLFGNRVSKRSDFEWTLNQAHYFIEPTSEPGVLRIHLETETPSFDTFLAEIDASEKKPITSGFTWALHPGKNRLQVRPRNLAGREGIPSWIEVNFAE